MNILQTLIDIPVSYDTAEGKLLYFRQLGVAFQPTNLVKYALTTLHEYASEKYVVASLSLFDHTGGNPPLNCALGACLGLRAVLEYVTAARDTLIFIGGIAPTDAKWEHFTAKFQATSTSRDLFTMSKNKRVVSLRTALSAGPLLPPSFYNTHKDNFSDLSSLAADENMAQFESTFSSVFSILKDLPLLVNVKGELGVERYIVGRLLHPFLHTEDWGVRYQQSPFVVSCGVQSLIHPVALATSCEMKPHTEISVDCFALDQTVKAVVFHEQTKDKFQSGPDEAAPEFAVESASALNMLVAAGVDSPAIFGAICDRECVQFYGSWIEEAPLHLPSTSARVTRSSKRRYDDISAPVSATTTTPPPPPSSFSSSTFSSSPPVSTPISFLSRSFRFAVAPATTHSLNTSVPFSSTVFSVSSSCNSSSASFSSKAEDSPSAFKTPSTPVATATSLVGNGYRYFGAVTEVLRFNSPANLVKIAYVMSLLARESEELAYSLSHPTGIPLKLAASGERKDDSDPRPPPRGGRVLNADPSLVNTPSSCSTFPTPSASFLSPLRSPPGSPFSCVDEAPIPTPYLTCPWLPKLSVDMLKAAPEFRSRGIVLCGECISSNTGRFLMNAEQGSLSIAVKVFEEQPIAMLHSLEELSTDITAARNIGVSEILDHFPVAGVGYAVVTPWYPGRSRVIPTSETHRKIYFTALLKYVLFLMSRDIVHGDLSPDNIVYDSNTGSLHVVDNDRMNRWGKMFPYENQGPWIPIDYWHGITSRTFDAYSVGILLTVSLLGSWDEVVYQRHSQKKKEVE